MFKVKSIKVENSIKLDGAIMTTTDQSSDLAFGHCTRVVSTSAGAFILVSTGEGK